MLRSGPPNRLSFRWIAVAFALFPALGFAAPPEEVGTLTWTDAETLTWASVPEAATYNVYRTRASLLIAGASPRCHADDVLEASLLTADLPPTGDAFAYLVAAENSLGEEGSLGSTAWDAPRVAMGQCDTVLRHHMLSRIAHGGDAWSRDRLALLGPTGFIDEQLDPASIDEASNFSLVSRLTQLEPPDNLNELVQAHLVRGMYGRRQLEQSVTMFWDNHFNADWTETASFLYIYYNPDLDPNFPERWFRNTTELHHRQFEEFRALAFNGNFRDIVWSSATSPSMLIYLDTIENKKDAPNENYPRELLELHTMGVDGGYTQQDVEELARVLTGWTVCRKTIANEGNPLAPCIDPFLGGEGDWTGHFDVSQHDAGTKVLFAGTPHETVIPDTTASPLDGVNDLSLAIDAIVAHPATPRFIARKLLEAYVVENPGEPMVDAVVERWNQTDGDLREVLREVLEQPEALSPELAGGKIKTPYEHIVSMYRGLEASTFSFSLPFIENQLYVMGHNLHRNPVPTGYPEVGRPWINTNAILDRQKFGIDVATNVAFGANPAGLVAGLTDPNDIVAFFADRLLGGQITGAQRSRALSFLTTDDGGAPAPLTAERINETAAYILGLAQFLEQ